jgi:hypothetical protein
VLAFRTQHDDSDKTVGSESVVQVGDPADHPDVEEVVRRAPQLDSGNEVVADRRRDSVDLVEIARHRRSR